MSKINVIKEGEDYYVEISNDFAQFLSIKVKLTKGEIENLNAKIISILEK